MSSMKSYFRRLAEGYEDGFGAKLLQPVLGLASGLYGTAAGMRRGFYESGIFKAEKLPYPVISVGNVTWGGTGKTPLVEYVARRIAERQKTALVLTRGYGKDEDEQYRQHLSKAVVGVGQNRLAVAKAITQKQRVDAAVLDDGLQHLKIKRDFEIVNVNALNPFGNGSLLPRGILRESVTVIKKAHAVVIMHSDLIPKKDLDALKEKLRKLSPEAILVEAYLEPLFFYRAKKRARFPVNKLLNQKVTTFSGVGCPHSFRVLLTKIKVKPIRNFEFGDHHPFTEKELKEVKEVSDSAYAEEIITTEKDFYRSPELISEVLNPLVLATRLRIHSGEEEFNRRLMKTLEGAPHS